MLWHVLLHGVKLGVAGILILVAAGRMTVEALPGFCIALSNTFGVQTALALLIWTILTAEYLQVPKGVRAVGYPARGLF